VLKGAGAESDEDSQHERYIVQVFHTKNYSLESNET